MKHKLIDTIAGVRSIRKRITFILLAIVLVGSASLIFTNYFTIRILSAARATVNGESEYSKGQKDAAACLTKYIYIGDEADYTIFTKAISIPINDRKARIALSADNINYNEASTYLLKGKSHPDDIEDLVWMFREFRHLAMFNKAIKLWAKGNTSLDKMNKLGLRAHQMMAGGDMTPDEKKAMIMSISTVSAQTAAIGEEFADALGEISRTTKTYVFIANVFIILLIVISSLTYAGIMIRKLSQSQKRVIAQNEDLQVINAGLDKFVFNVTHDLRSPLASLAGLTDLIDDETDLDQIKAYT